MATLLHDVSSVATTTTFDVRLLLDVAYMHGMQFVRVTGTTCTVRTDSPNAPDTPPTIPKSHNTESTLANHHLMTAT